VVDILWIGARNNREPVCGAGHPPDVLEGTNQLPVMVKKSVNPDLELWIGAFERLEKAGITDLTAIHPGFSAFTSTQKTANVPNWELPIALRETLTAHSADLRSEPYFRETGLLLEVSQKAMDLNSTG